MVFGLCRRKKEAPKTLADTFGEMLEEIDKELRASESRLMRKRVAHSNFVRSLIFWSIAIYGFILAGAYLYQADPKVFWQKALRMGPIFAFPLFIFITKKIGDAYYTRAIQKESLNLTTLNKERQQKCVELEAKTDWKKIQKLLGKTDPPPQPQQPTQRPGRGGPANGPDYKHNPNSTGGGGGGGGGGGNVYVPRTHDIIIPKPRGRADKLVDYILNDGPNNRFALICAKCFTHNGLARGEDVASIRYRCTYCSHLNGPPLPGGAAAAAVATPSKPASNGTAAGGAVNSTAAGDVKQPPATPRPEGTPVSGGSGSGSDSEEGQPNTTKLPPPTTPAHASGAAAAPAGPPSFVQMTPAGYAQLSKEKQVEYQKWFKEFKARVQATPKGGVVPVVPGGPPASAVKPSTGAAAGSAAASASNPPPVPKTPVVTLGHP